MSAAPDRTLIIEVGLNGDLYSYQLTTDRIWREVDGVMRELTEPSAGMRACLRMEALRRYLDLPVSENLLDWQARELWKRHFPSARVTAWSIASAVSAPESVEEPFAVCQELVRELPNHPSAVHLVDPTLSLHADFGPLALAPPPGEIGVPEPIHWCDVETIPPRTVAVNGLPQIHVNAESVDVNATAFGPQGRQPAATILMATIWDTATEDVLANVVLSYDLKTHTFRGCGPRKAGDYRIDGLGVDPTIGADVSAAEQLHPLPRDDAHDQAWLRWWRLNKARRELARAFLADGSTADVLTLAEKIWALRQPEITVAIVDEDDWLLGVVELEIPGLGTAHFSPCQPAIDSGVWGMDTRALRRVAVVEFFAKCKGDLAGETRKAWGIDKGLAHAGAGDIRTARRHLLEHGEWLYRLGQRVADRSHSEYLLGEIARCCKATASFVGDPLASRLRETASTLTAGSSWSRDSTDDQTPIHARGAEHCEVRVLACRLWLARRAAHTEALVLGQSLPSTQRRAKLLARQLRRSQVGDHWASEVAQLATYPTGQGVADRPLLAELVLLMDGG